MRDLFAPVGVGPLRLGNRIVMAPMSRNRADAAEAAHALTATYYAQRAGAGLIVTEASPVSPQGRAGPGAPGIWNGAQVAGWRLTTEAVHAKGGRIFLQLWHAGKVPLALEEIPAAVSQFAAAAGNAKDAGFDGIEVHAANGYLIDRFLRDGSNRRRDAYGGTLENRARFLFEVLDAVGEAWERGRIAVRLSPANPYNDMRDSDPQRAFGELAQRLGERGLAFLHVDEGGEGFDWKAFRRRYAGTYIANGGYDRERAAAAIESGHADLVSFGVLYLANPDLPERLRLRAPLNRPDRATFYGGGERGYTDYAALGEGQ
ncbi:MAG TPA: alkene reductase [Burkholderiales bacterium]|nr:alkene reductase [Burkholderiales bacterium]